MWRQVEQLSAERRGIWVVLLFVLLLVAHVLVTRYVISKDRDNIEQNFSEERLEQMQEAIENVEENLDDIVDDLALAHHLVAADGTVERRKAHLRALLGSVKPYRGTFVVDEDGERVIELDNERQGSEMSEAADRGVDDITQRVFEVGEEELVVSEPIVENDEDGEERVVRLFGTQVSFDDGAERASLVLVVDCEPVFSPLRLVASDAHTSLLMLGQHGEVEPPSAERLEEAIIEGTFPRLDPLVERIERREKGSLRLEAETAERLGFDQNEAVGTYGRIRLEGEPHWGVAAISSMAALHEREEKMVRRLGAASAVIALFWLGFGGYYVVSSRRRAALSERLRVARQLAHLNEKADKVLESIPSAVMVVSEDGRVSGVNRAFRDRLAEIEEGEPLSEIFEQADPGDLAHLEGLVEHALDEQAAQSMVDEQCSLFFDDGQYRIRAVPLEPAEPDASVLVVFDDFSELHQLERQLLRAEKLTTVGILAAGIAHEVGTPLGVVRGRAEYLQYKLTEDDPARDSLEIIVDQIDRVSRVIQGLLDFSREEKPAVVTVDLAEAVEQVVELLRYEMERREVEVSLDVAEDLDPLAADPDELQQVLVNLLVNACDASQPGDVVTIAARSGTDESSDRILITVEDTGKGISEEKIHQVFDPFYTTKKRGKGTGLGLPIVAKIVRNHGGQIDIDSEMKVGTTVRIRWPKAGYYQEDVDEHPNEGDQGTHSGRRRPPRDGRASG